MNYSPNLGSNVTNTHIRYPSHVADVSGMCAACTADCSGLCEIGLSAIRGAEAITPFSADKNQFASEKRYPLDYSHFAINGRVFGALGCPEDPFEATFPKADIRSTFGLKNGRDIKAPFILPAMAKLAWREYFSGASIFGVPAVIGEDVITKDPGLELDGHKVVTSPLIDEMVNTYKRYQGAYGDIVLQANYDDEYHHVLEYAIGKLNITSVELKFGQAAKGIQGMGPVPDIEDARLFKKRGYIVFPDPTDPDIIQAYEKGTCPVFQRIGKLPMWKPEELGDRVDQLRRLGAERICFKTGPFDPRDLRNILEIASEAGIDLVTLDGAGGGTGNSPVKMMNEWGIPTVTLETIVYRILHDFEKSGKALPPVAIAGGFATEDQVFKGLSLGAPYVRLVAIGRAAMAAASVGKQVGEAIEKGTVPKQFAAYGSRIEEIFADYGVIKAEYGDEISRIPPGALGLYSYLHRVSVGLQQFMALNRKFSLSFIDRSDIVSLTEIATGTTGLPGYTEILNGKTADTGGTKSL